MRFPIIKIRDTDTGYEHIIGTNEHDCLRVKEDGQTIMYFNYQNIESSGKNSFYRFTGEEKDLTDLFGTYETEIEFVTFEELTKIYEEQKEKQKERNELFQKIMADFQDD